jgi:predicted lipoprotein
MRATRLIVLLSFSAAACNSAGTPAVDYSALLKSLDAVVVPETAKFATSAAALSTALAAIGGSSASLDASSLATAQTAWRAARLDWRHLDATYFGPLLTLGLTDRIDATPADDSGIDGIVNGTQTIDATLIGTLGGPQKGFLGIEYLIFSASGNEAVLTSLTGTSGAPARRRALAAAMSVEVASSAQQLATAWSPSGGNYVAQVETAGMGSTTYSQQRGALDDYVGGAAYALELVVGVRLAGPLGRKTTGMPDPASDPTSASDSAVADMTGSLAGVSALYQGMGYSSMVQTMNSNFNMEAQTDSSACAKSITAIPPPFVTSVVSDNAVVQNAYTTCKTWKDNWNIDISSALGATVVPDNDGD